MLISSKRYSASRVKYSASRDKYSASRLSNNCFKYIMITLWKDIMAKNDKDYVQELEDKISKLEGDVKEKVIENQSTRHSSDG